MKRIALFLTLFVFSGGPAASYAQQEAPQQEAPNVVLIMADDLGYSDLGSFGAVHVETPHLDRLAEQGMRFTQFYNMAKCSPTRTSLLSGLYTKKRHAGHAQALPHLLRQAGYYTATAGKEHFSAWYPERLYAEKVFDDAFVYAVINPYFIPAEGSFKHPFRLNGDTLDTQEIKTSRKPFYKTDVVTSYALRFLDTAKNAATPFFLYLPYHVPHYPLQARGEDIQRYEGAFEDGWDALRRKRFARQKELGVLPPNAELTKPESNIYPHGGPTRSGRATTRGAALQWRGETIMPARWPYTQP